MPFHLNQGVLLGMVNMLTVMQQSCVQHNPHIAQESIVYGREFCTDLHSLISKGYLADILCPSAIEDTDAATCRWHMYESMRSEL